MATVGQLVFDAIMNTSSYTAGAKKVEQANNTVTKSTKKAAESSETVSGTVQKASKNIGKSGSSIQKSFSLQGVAAGAAAALTTKAFDAISSHVSSAVKRVDTLRQFPKVMQNLGYSAEEAADAIEDISTRLTGLPTATDEIANYTKRLAGSSSSLKEASDLALALNDAMLAGGAGTQVASAATEQFVQMLSSGNVDMQAWRSVLTAAQPQVRQLAEDILGAGASTDDLYEGLKNGSVSMDTFKDAIIRLDQEGGDGITSFSEQAKTATDGIESGWTRMGTAIDRGLQAILEAVGADTIGNAIAGIGSAFENVLKAVAPFIGSVGQGLINTFNILAGVVGVVTTPLQAIAGAIQAIGGDTASAAVISGIATAIGLVVAAITAYHIALAIAKGVTVAFEIATTAAKVATSLFNAVLAANPLTLIITAVLAIITAIVTWITTTDEGKAAWQGFCDGVKELIDGFVEKWNAFWDKVAEIWNNFWEGLQQFFTDLGQGFKDAGQTISNIWNDVLDFVRTIPEKIIGFFKNIGKGVSDKFQQIKDGAKEKFDSLVDWVKNVPQRIKDALGNVGKLLFDAGEAILNSLWDGLKSIWNNLTGWIGDIAGWIAEHKGPISYDRKLLIPAGKAIMQGLAEGLTDSFDLVENAVNKTNSTLAGVSGSASYSMRTSIDGTPINDTALSEGKIRLDTSTLGSAFGNALSNKKWVLTTSGRSLAVMMIDDIDKELQLKAERQQY